jgi:LuxR family maltose regulon positive regulatory protein
VLDIVATHPGLRAAAPGFVGRLRPPPTPTGVLLTSHPPGHGSTPTRVPDGAPAALPAAEGAPHPAPVGDRLSDRELAVLSYLPTMLTTAEIAAEMYVSVNTVKTHLKNIYRKLDVARRRDAVHRARALRLL